jgi:tetratricopeptide (TPR) repeat protein
MPSIAEALQLALSQHQAGQLDQAEQIYRQILQHQPDHPDALNLLGLLASTTGRHLEAVQLIEQAVRLDPSSAFYRGNLGFAFLVGGRYQESLVALEAAIGRDPNHADALANLGAVYHKLGRLEESIASFRRCLQIQPAHAAGHGNLGLALQDAAQFTEARQHFERAIELDPHNDVYRCNLGFVLLTVGDFSAGWSHYERRLEWSGVNIQKLPEPKWDGSPLVGRTLLIHCEQGFGDTLQFVRYLKMIKPDGGKIVLATQRELISLLAQSGFTSLVDLGEPLPEFDVHLPLLSLPRVFGTTLETIPGSIPYLTADAARIAAWREKLSAYSGLKVGISWQGRKTFPADRLRSIPLAYFAPLAEIAGARFFSLQKGDGREQLPAIADRLSAIDLSDSLETFLDTAAAMKNLDLVITSDTAVAHLAGALGVPVWVALSRVPDWRWLCDRCDNPWYPTMRLFRQSRHGDWADVFQRIHSALAEIARGVPGHS